jgi:hypothetical protein
LVTQTKDQKIDAKNRAEKAITSQGDMTTKTKGTTLDALGCNIDIIMVLGDHQSS